MQCRSCGTQLAEGAAYCPTCGTATPYTVAASGISPYDPTVASSPSGAPLQAPPAATNYSSPPYGMPEPDPYKSFNPYEAPLQTPPPPPRKVSPVMLGILIAVVLLMVGASVGFVLLRNQQTKTTVLPTTTTSTVNNTGIADTNATATAEANPYGGTLVLSDPLNDNSKGYGWAEFTNNATACRFTAGAYEVDTPTHIFQACYATSSPQFSNFAFEIQMKIVKGDCGAILFRANNPNNSFYYFQICQNGLYSVGIHNGPTWNPFVDYQPSSAFHQGLNQTNLVAVVAEGSSFDLYSWLFGESRRLSHG